MNKINGLNDDGDACTVDDLTDNVSNPGAAPCFGA